MKDFAIIIISAALAVASCSEGVDPSSPAQSDSYELSHDMIVLGEKLNDPYTVENVAAALESLYPTRATRRDITATDIYVRFLPADQEQYDLLLARGLILSDHPLDYEILRDGDYYHDPSVPDGDITWQYAVVKSGFDFRLGVTYEILDECFISDNDIHTRSDEGIDWAAVEREAFRLTGNGSLLSPVTRAGDSKPQGSIRIIDDRHGLGSPMGVAGVMVTANVFVKVAVGYTDEEGNYTLDKMFSSDPHYRLVFKNKRGFGIGLNLFLVPASTSALGKCSPDGVDVLLDKDSDRSLFTRCAVNNAVNDYFAMCSDEDEGISAPPSNLRLWLFKNLESSSAPMLQQGAFVDKYLLTRYLGDYGSLVRMFLPDITLGMKSCEDYAAIYEMTVHELSHASHFMKAGKAYWDKYIYYIIKSFLTSSHSPYGVKGSADSGYCAVGEMWGYFMQNSLYKARYGRSDHVAGVSWWFSPQVFMYLEERGMSRGKIFQALNPEVTDVEKLEKTLSNLCPEYSSMIHQAFERYDY